MKIEKLEELARTMVGDGEKPNVFFVSESGEIRLVTTDFDLAYQCWRNISESLERETALEDRLNGTLASVQPEYESGCGEQPAPLQRFDDTRGMLR